ncbi:cilia- and flagella-associated protein 90-like [Hydractinia symbiolongicarpus]|uniref:cilia- and flagella-associated protein 90-like n=1 Tax=Hydractinia symbiolongicarpus TaxID=13093 RepID=UPI00254BDDBA|nr:cilia- and flagella-associated protein 90-like [Hydractinia symbiolongicarpus]
MPHEDNEPVRSNYGLKTYTPEETKNQWKETVNRQRLIHMNHKCAEKERKEIKEFKLGNVKNLSYFNNNKEHCLVSAYDRQFHAEEGYHSKLTRDDRKHMLGLNVNFEERPKKVPILSSSAYGHRKPLEHAQRKFCRVALVRRDFYRDCGTNIPSRQE